MADVGVCSELDAAEVTICANASELVRLKRLATAATTTGFFI